MAREWGVLPFTEKIRWAATTKYDIKLGYTPEPPDGQLNCNYLIAVDGRSGMLNVIFGDLLCLDIDSGNERVDKEYAAARLAEYAQQKDLCFRVFETLHGLHAYCTSRTFPWHAEETRAEMEAVLNTMPGSRPGLVDDRYFAFAAVRAFPSRLSPKGDSPTAMKADFVMRPWTDDDHFDQGHPRWEEVPRQDLCLSSKVTFLLRLVEFTRTMYRKMHPDFLASNGHFIADERSQMLLSVSRYAEAIYGPNMYEQSAVKIPQVVWATSGGEGQNRWTWKDPAEPNSAKVTVFRSTTGELSISSMEPDEDDSVDQDGGTRWKIVIQGQFSEEYPTRKAAKRAADEAYSLSPNSLAATPMSSRQKSRLKFGDVHKYGDRCFRCGRRGHWAGDDDCQQ
jgi:hypothetical protein